MGIKKKQLLGASIVSVVLVLVTSVSIFNYNTNYFSRRTDAITALKVGDNIYKVSFPFLGGSTVFEKSIDKFKKENPTKKINHIYTVPKELRLKKADALIFYIVTEDKE
jgi:ABC-type glycerol-3-phosphate transport system substrate-binding protein